MSRCTYVFVQVGFLLLLSASSHALTMAYTDSASFLAALPGAATTVDFDSSTSGTLIADGGTFDGLTFDYPGLAGFGVSLAITDGSAFGGGGPFSTTSAPLFLGTDDADLLQAGDNLDISFASSSAIGLFIITADVPHVTILDGDLELSVGSVTAVLDVDADEGPLFDGSSIFFLGVIDTDAAFTTASLTTPVGGGPPGSFLFNIDDITTAVAVPGPGTGVLVALGFSGLAWKRRRK